MKISEPPEGEQRGQEQGRGLDETLRAGARDLLLAAIEREIVEQMERIAPTTASDKKHIPAPDQSVNEDVLKARNLESLAILADGLAHDFNNLLMTILGNVSLARNQLKPADKPYGRLMEAERACMAGKELTRRLITFSKSSGPSKKVLSIPALLKECTAVVGAHIDVKFLLADGLRSVEADEEQIKQVFAHILINAKEAMGEGGTITIRGDNVILTGQEDLPLAAGNYVRLLLSDTGTGIAKENLSKIFDPYFTTKERGTERGAGLGLAIVYSVLKKHGGYITVESTVGRGTTFCLYLPALENEPPREPERGAKSAGRILVMDDEDVVRETIAEMLLHIGYEVRCVKTGQETLLAFKEARESGLAFDAVILDLMTDNGMGGEETLQQLRSIDPSVKAVASSGFSRRAAVSELKDYGFAAVISKPYKIEELRETLKSVLEG